MEDCRMGFSTPECSFYDGDEEFVHDACYTLPKQCPYSAKMEARKYFTLPPDVSAEVPVWNLNEDDWEDSSTESEQALNEVRLKGRGRLAVENLPG